jgi:nitroreductase
MQKLAQTTYPIHNLLSQRWSPLAFSSQPVTPTDLGSVLEAARWSASCFNEQPWSFIVATQAEQAGFDRLLSCLVEANQEWAKTAPVLMISVAKLSFTHNGNPNRHAFHDVGAASTSMAIQAMALGLYLHQMGGFDVAKAIDLYQIPAGYEPVAAIALGYLGDPQTLSEKLQQRQASERSRKPLKEFVFAGSWQRPLSLQ